MKLARHSALIGLLCLSACKSGPQPYDGVVGYQVQRDKDHLRIVYLAEADVSWTDLGQAAAQVCAQELKLDRDGVALAHAEFGWIDQQVDTGIAMPVPQGSVGRMQFNILPEAARAASGAASDAASGAAAPNDHFVKQLRLKRLNAECLAVPELAGQDPAPAPSPKPSPILPPGAR